MQVKSRHLIILGFFLLLTACGGVNDQAQIKPGGKPKPTDPNNPNKPTKPQAVAIERLAKLSLAGFIEVKRHLDIFLNFEFPVTQSGNGCPGSDFDANNPILDGHILTGLTRWSCKGKNGFSDIETYKIALNENFPAKESYKNKDVDHAEIKSSEDFFAQIVSKSSTIEFPLDYKVAAKKLTANTTQISYDLKYLFENKKKLVRVQHYINLIYDSSNKTIGSLTSDISYKIYRTRSTLLATETLSLTNHDAPLTLNNCGLATGSVMVKEYTNSREQNNEIEGVIQTSEKELSGFGRTSAWKGCPADGSAYLENIADQLL